MVTSVKLLQFSPRKVTYRLSVRDCSSLVAPNNNDETPATGTNLKLSIIDQQKESLPGELYRVLCNSKGKNWHLTISVNILLFCLLLI